MSLYRKNVLTSSLGLTLTSRRRVALRRLDDVVDVVLRLLKDYFVCMACAFLWIRGRTELVFSAND